MSKLMLPELPSQAPRTRRGLLTIFSRGMLHLTGWRLKGTFPDEPKLVLIGAPHSSYWDGVWGLLIKAALHVDINIMIKHEAMTGLLGRVLHGFGMIPVDRKAAVGVVEQMQQRFQQHEHMWLGIMPEGTRKKVKHWKSGFLRIARAADVPILPVFLDYPSKTFTLGTLQRASGDLDADLMRIRALFAGCHGKHRGV